MTTASQQLASRIATRTLIALMATSLLIGVAGQLAADDDYYAAPVSGVDRRVTYYHHASTYQEGVQRGRADVISATGEALRNAAIARVYNQEARTKRIQNDYNEVANHFAKKELNRQARFGKSKARAQYNAEFEAASVRKPKRRLSTRHLDPVSGMIAWTETLETPEFAAERSALDELFAARAARTGKYRCEDIRNVTDQMLTRLRSKIRDMEPQEYVDSKSLIRGLAEEARLPVSTTLVAN